MKPQRNMPEMLAEPFDYELLGQFQSTAVLDGSIARLCDLGIDYGNTDATSGLSDRPGLTLEQKHERFYQRLFAASIRLAYGLEERIDVGKYVQQTMEPIINSALGANSVHVVSVGRGSKRHDAKDSGELRQFTRGMDELSDGIRSGVSAILESIPDAITRMKIIDAEARTVVSAFKEELHIGTDRNSLQPAERDSQYAIVKLLSSDIGSSNTGGFRDEALALATFFGIADYDKEHASTYTAVDLVDKLKDGFFDSCIAKEVLHDIVEKQADGDRLSDEEAELYRMLEIAQFYSGDPADFVIDHFVYFDGLDFWSKRCKYLFIGKREWFARAIQANTGRVQALIYENYLGALPTGVEDFKYTINRAFKENIEVTRINGMDIDRANRLRQRAEMLQRERRMRLLRRVVGEEALEGARVEVETVERPLAYLKADGSGVYTETDDPEEVFARFLKTYGNDPVLRQDLENSIDYLRKLTPKEMARLLSQGNGLRTLNGNSIRYNGGKLTVHRMKPKRLPGLRTQSPATGNMRVMFVQLKQGGIGITDVVRRDKLSQYQARTYVRTQVVPR